MILYYLTLPSCYKLTVCSSFIFTLTVGGTATPTVTCVTLEFRPQSNFFVSCHYPDLFYSFKIINHRFSYR